MNINMPHYGRLVILRFLVSLVMRLLGGEAYLSWRATVAYPGYDADTNTQYFPYEALSMLCGRVVMLAVSYLTDCLMRTDRIDMKWLRMINNRIDRLPVNTDEDSNAHSANEELIEVKKDLMSNEQTCLVLYKNLTFMYMF